MQTLPRCRQRDALCGPWDGYRPGALRVLQEVPRPAALMPSPLEESVEGLDRAFIDLHCHTSASFDSLASPGDIVRAAARRGLTHLAVTDHDRIDGALRARDAAPDRLTIIVGEEVTTSDDDLIAAFLERAVPHQGPCRRWSDTAGRSHCARGRARTRSASRWPWGCPVRPGTCRSRSRRSGSPA
jgi:hypothetical protein